jgi:hypothetical protein
MQIQLLQDKHVEYIDNILLKDGKLQVLPAVELLQINNYDLRLWCHHKGIYGIPSQELIDIINTHLVAYKSIEVGGGCGVFGRALNIPSTDSMIQSNPAVAAYYAALQQPVVSYGKDVIELEASAAINKFKADVVFGSWVTQYHSPLDTETLIGGGSVHGLRESEFMPLIKKYIVYGNDLIHGQKEIFMNPKYKVERIYNVQDFFSRASKPELNCLYIVTHA